MCEHCIDDCVDQFLEMDCAAFETLKASEPVKQLAVWAKACIDDRALGEGLTASMQAWRIYENGGMINDIDGVGPFLFNVIETDTWSTADAQFIGRFLAATPNERAVSLFLYCDKPWTHRLDPATWASEAWNDETLEFEEVNITPF